MFSPLMPVNRSSLAALPSRDEISAARQPFVDSMRVPENLDENDLAAVSFGRPPLPVMNPMDQLALTVTHRSPLWRVRSSSGETATSPHGRPGLFSDVKLRKRNNKMQPADKSSPEGRTDLTTEPRLPRDQFTDPVCGMSVDPSHAAGSVVHDGRTYYFCSQSCRQKFQAEPKRYLGPHSTDEGGMSQQAKDPTGGTVYTCPMHPEVRQDRPGTCPKCGMSLEPIGDAPAPTKVEYSCPMHPQIVRDRPGSCPICGMALEPRTVTLEEGPNPELADMSRRFWVGLALSLPIFLLAMGDMLPGKPLHHLLSMTTMNWGQLALATPVVFWCGWPFFERAWSSVIHRSPNMFTLIALGVGAAYLYSLVATVAPGLFPEGFRAVGGAVMPYFDTAVVVTVLILLGQVLELKARGRTSGAIKRLLGLAPKTARRVEADGTEEDAPSTLR